jgi:hypothetical protein
MTGKRIVGAAVVAALSVPTLAGAHVERAAYWPDPAPDCTIKPCAGGKVPNARSLASALNPSSAAHTRVVCRPDSITRLRRSIKRAVARGYDIRPHDHRKLSAAAGRRLLRINKALRGLCSFHQIQAAITASDNDDRVVVMPGLYTEPASRKARTFDPACNRYKGAEAHGGTGALSYEGQFHCPNDQNLIAVLGRAVGTGSDPTPALEDRRGIPNLGACIRCNLQVEGSGVSADDVIVDAGRVASGNHGPANPIKDVGIRVDRADGFVLRNITVRHVREHGIYVLESDGYLLDRFKTYYANEYGVLTFVEDHGVMQNCEAVGSGDSGLYPGAGAEGGDQRSRGEPFHYTQEIRYCDSHHNAGGYSGTDGNSTWIHDNNFYDNALGWTTDVFTAAGHPGFPQDSDLVENNNFYSNNFNPYVKGSDVKPTVPVPVGTALWIAGGNGNVFRYNRIWDNWRRGPMLFSVPDATVCGPAIGSPVTGCDPTKISTSFNNRFYGNVMGIAPDGTYKPNGVDFWWDSGLSNTGNCWYSNRAAPGHRITTSPASLPACGNGLYPLTSLGTGYAPNELELLGCFATLVNGYNYDPDRCDWFKTPPRPSAG